LPRTHKQGLTVDHFMPISKGGTDEMDNLRPAHWICNVRKRDKVITDA
jgi:5-methylcytosine-specific restriction endonuclease McrA